MENIIIKKKLNECEIKLDSLNGAFGDKNAYCLFCKSREYNGKVGIIHTNDCLMTKIREIIKEYK